jgi:UDPglucose 6-dehydrogenase
MREAPSRSIIAGFIARGATVAAYDPVAMPEAQRVLGVVSGLSYAASPLDAVSGADALVVVTEWREFRSPDFGELKRRLKQPLIFDGRNLYDPALARAAGLEYFGIGRS